MSTLRVTIPGTPQQQGSKRHVGRGVMIDDNKNLASWRADAIVTLRAAAGPDWEPLTGPLRVDATFCFPRPKSHFGTGRNANRLKPSAPTWKTSAPDTDKLERALGDALTQAGIIRDDALIALWTAGKRFSTKPRVTVTVRELS